MSTHKLPKKLVAIDFDKTLCKDANFGPMNLEIEKLMRRYYDAGCTVVIYTARPEEDRHLLTSWLVNKKVLYDALVMGKLRFDVLIDDRCVNTNDATAQVVDTLLESV